MNNKHLNIDQLTEYFLNNLSRDNETVVQEHLNSCADCSEKLANIRLLKKSIFETDDSQVSTVPSLKPSFKILSSNWIRFSAAAVVIIGAGLGFYLSKDNGFSTINQGIVPETVLSIDSLSKEDCIDYYSPDEKSDSTSTDSLSVIKPR